MAEAESINVDEISEILQTRLFETRQPITARWICYEHLCSMPTAQSILHTLCTRNKEKVAVSYLVDGILQDSGQRSVRIVPGVQMAAIKELMEDSPSEQIYSVSPSQESTESAVLIAADLEQARLLMSSLLSSGSDKKTMALANNSWSTVKGVPCPRQLGPRPPTKANAGVSTAELPPKPAPRAASAQVSDAKKTSGKADGQKTSNLPPRAASAAATLMKNSVKEEKQPEKAPAPAKPKNPLAASFGKTAAKKSKPKTDTTSATKANNDATKVIDDKVQQGDKDKKTSAELKSDSAAKQKLSNQNKQERLVDSDDEEQSASGSPLQTRKARQKIGGESESDDDFEAPRSKDAHVKGTSQPLKTDPRQQPVDRPRHADVDRGADVDMADTHDCIPAVKGTAATAVASEQCKENSVQAVRSDAGAENAHPEYGVPPHPDAEINMVGSKAFWQYISDTGEEISVIAQAKKKCNSTTTKQESAQAKRRQPDTKEQPDSAVEKQAKKKKTGKAAKTLAGVGDIRSMFGQK